MPLMIKLNRNIVRVDLCLDNGHFITVFRKECGGCYFDGYSYAWHGWCYGN